MEVPPNSGETNTAQAAQCARRQCGQWQTCHGCVRDTGTVNFTAPHRQLPLRRSEDDEDEGGEYEAVVAVAMVA